MSVVLPLPLSPTMAMRSAQPTASVTGPSVNPPRRTTAPSSRATTAPARGAAAISNWSCQPSHGLSTTSNRSIARCDRLARPASCSVVSAFALRSALSLSGCLRLARATPSVIHSRSRWALACKVSRASV